MRNILLQLENYKMKKTFMLAAVLILGASVSFAQVTPEAFIGILPAIPNNVCSMKMAERNQYISRIDTIMQLIDNEIARRNEEIDANSSTEEQQALNNVASQYGLSNDDIKKLQNEEGMTEEEKNEIINKALQNKHNMTLDETKKFDKMTKEGKKSWGEAYGTEKMADVQTDPQKSQEEQYQNKSLYELTNIQKHIIDSLKAIESKFAQQISDIDNDPDAKVMLDNIAKWDKEALDLMGETDNEGMQKMTELENKIKTEKDKYCSKYTPKYIDILKKYESYTKSSMPVCYRIEAISSRLTKLQTGVDLKHEPGLVGIGKIADYVHLLQGVFKYNLLKD